MSSKTHFVDKMGFATTHFGNSFCQNEFGNFQNESGNSFCRNEFQTHFGTKISLGREFPNSFCKMSLGDIVSLDMHAHAATNTSPAAAFGSQALFVGEFKPPYPFATVQCSAWLLAGEARGPWVQTQH